METPTPGAAPAVKVVDLVKPRRPSLETPASLTTSEEIPAVPAPFVLRLISWIVDLGILVLVALIFARLNRAFRHLAPPPVSMETGLDWLADRAVAYRRSLGSAVVAGVAAEVLYTTLMVGLLGRTLGAWLTGLFVVNHKGKRPGMILAAIRAIAGVVSGGALLMGFWLAAFIPSRRALHDFAGGTFVVRRRRA